MVARLELAEATRDDPRRTYRCPPSRVAELHAAPLRARPAIPGRRGAILRGRPCASTFPTDVPGAAGHWHARPPPRPGGPRPGVRPRDAPAHGGLRLAASQRLRDAARANRLSRPADWLAPRAPPSLAGLSLTIGQDAPWHANRRRRTAATFAAALVGREGPTDPRVGTILDPPPRAHSPTLQVSAASGFGVQRAAAAGNAEGRVGRRARSRCAALTLGRARATPSSSAPRRLADRLPTSVVDAPPAAGLAPRRPSPGAGGPAARGEGLSASVRASRPPPLGRSALRRFPA